VFKTGGSNLARDCCAADTHAIGEISFFALLQGCKFLEVFQKHRFQLTTVIRARSGLDIGDGFGSLQQLKFVSVLHVGEDGCAARPLHGADTTARSSQVF
jgi:hypothetical protein